MASHGDWFPFRRASQDALQRYFPSDQPHITTQLFALLHEPISNPLSSWLNASLRMPVEAASSPHDVLVDCSVLFRRSPLILSPRYAAIVLNLDHQWHVRLKGWHRHANHASL